MPRNRESPSGSGSHDRDRDNTSSSHPPGTHSHGHHHSRRHHSHSHRRRRFRLKQKERNFLAAVCSMIVIVTLCTAMAEPNWFYVRGGGCNVNTLGAYQFFYLGHFEQPFSRNERQTVYVYSANPSDRLVDCVNVQAVDVMRGIIAMCFIGVALSLVAFFLDLSGPTARVLKIIRRNAIGNILTVLVCVTIHGFCYWETQLVEELQNRTKHHKGSKVEVKFDVSFYLIAAAGGMSVVATACNLLRRYPPYESESRENPLLDDYDGMDFVGTQTNEAYSPMSVVPPPPAYSP